MYTKLSISESCLMVESATLCMQAPRTVQAVAATASTMGPIPDQQQLSGGKGSWPHGDGRTAKEGFIDHQGLPGCVDGTLQASKSLE